MVDTTVIYITSNQERVEFENKIIESLVASANGLPIISVSQKPINLGQNICVGNIGAKPENVLRQLIIGAQAAKTRFIAVGESDFLYPKEFFQFIPPTDDTFYYPDNVYIFWCHHNRFYRKQLREMLSVTNREHFANILERVLNSSFEHIVNSVKQITKQDTFHTDIPVITFKTRQGMHWKSPFQKHNWEKILPYWGTPDDLRKKYLCQE